MTTKLTPLAPVALQADAPTRYAASYARKSDENDFGIQAQHALNAARARDDGFIVPDDAAFRFDDDHTPGPEKSRRGLNRLRAMIESGQASFTRLYVKDMTRFGRFDDPRTHNYLEYHFQEHGVVVHYADKEKAQDALADPNNPSRQAEFLQSAFGAIAASEERHRLIKRVTGGQRDRVLRNFYPGAQAPYGTERWLADKTTGQLMESVPPGKIVRRAGCFFRLAWPNDSTREVIVRIFDEIEAGSSLRSVAKRLNEAGEPSPGHRRGRGQEGWTLESVRRIARNPIYCGTFIWGRLARARFGAPLDAHQSRADGDPAILNAAVIVGDAPVSRAQWTAVQNLLDGNVLSAASRRASRPEYLLSGMIQCAHCSACFHGHSAGSERRPRYYRHDPRRLGRRSSCPHDNRYIAAEPLEQAALLHLQLVLEGGELLSAVKDELHRRSEMLASGEHEARIREMERQAERHRSALNNAVEGKMRASSDAERQSYEVVIKRLSSEVEHYKRSIMEARQALETIGRVESRLENLQEWTAQSLAQAVAGSPADRKRLLRMLVHSVRIRPDSWEAELIVRPAA